MMREAARAARVHQTIDAIKILGGVHISGIGIGICIGLYIAIRARRPKSEIRT